MIIEQDIPAGIAVGVTGRGRDHTMNWLAILSQRTLVKRADKVDCIVVEVVEQTVVKVVVVRMEIEMVDKESECNIVEMIVVDEMLQGIVHLPVIASVEEWHWTVDQNRDMRLY